MMTYLQAILFGALQGVTELFPISSLGHSVMLPRLLGWHIDQHDPFFLTFLVATHTATATVLFFFFWKDWLRIGKGLLVLIQKRTLHNVGVDSKLALLLIIATLPAGALGLLAKDYLEELFASAHIVAGVLILNGFMLYGADIVRRKRAENNTQSGNDERIAKLSWKQALHIGLSQCIALIPGFSRTGATLTGGLLVGLSHQDAARFSFLLATPLIGAASVLKLPELLSEEGIAHSGPILVGSLSSALTAYLAVTFLTKYFETKKLRPFALYCLSMGIFASLMFTFR